MSITSRWKLAKSQNCSQRERRACDGSPCKTTTCNLYEMISLGYDSEGHVEAVYANFYMYIVQIYEKEERRVKWRNESGEKSILRIRSEYGLVRKLNKMICNNNNLLDLRRFLWVPPCSLLCPSAILFCNFLKNISILFFVGERFFSWRGKFLY